MGLLFIKKKKPLQLYFSLLPYLGGNQQAACECMMLAVKKVFEKRGYSFRAKRRKPVTNGYPFLLGIQTPYRNRKEKKKSGQGDELYKVLPKLTVAKSSMCFLSSALCLQRETERLRGSSSVVYGQLYCRPKLSTASCTGPAWLTLLKFDLWTIMQKETELLYRMTVTWHFTYDGSSSCHLYLTYNPL